MTKISDERLDELTNWIDGFVPAQGAWFAEVVAALRELRDYRKAVAEYLSAVDAVRGSEEWGAGWDRWRKAADLHKAAEVTLRALKERT